MDGKHHSTESKEKIGRSNGKALLRYKQSDNDKNLYVFDKEYEYTSLAATELKITNRSIVGVCNGNVRLCKGFLWRWKEDIEDITKPIFVRDIIISNPNGPMFGKEMSDEHKQKLREINIAIKGRSINQYDLTGKFIKNFRCINDAVKDLNIKNHGNISNCLNKKRKSAYGYIWKYADNQESNNLN